MSRDLVNRLQGLFYAFIGAVFISLGCGSDKVGDEIGAVRKNEYPESYTVRSADVFVAKGIVGPEDRSLLPERSPSTWKSYSEGGTSRLAVLLTDTASSWLGVVHGLKAMGVPFCLTTDYQRAIRHKVVMVYPIISGAALSPEALQALAAFPRNGGTLIGTQVLGALNEVFGFTEAVPSRQHFQLLINNDSSNIVREFSDPKELTIALGNKERFKQTIGTYSYSQNSLPPVATYEDKSAAIAQRFYESGKAYALGFDIGYMILKGNNVRHEDWNRSMANDFEPGMDVILRLLKNIYLENEPSGAFLCSVPYNRSLSVVITHNVDHPAALKQSMAFARMEQKRGIRSSYFIQTKYVRDRKPAIFSSAADFDMLGQLSGIGMDLQSQAVSGSYLFDQFEQGSGDETYPSYRPYDYAFEKNYGGNIFGEMRISRYLIDRFSQPGTAIAFRSGFPYTPFTYPQSLLSSGYRFGSTIPANQTLTHFPVQMTFNREYDEEMDVVEFPLTDDDQLPPFRAEQRLRTSLRLAEQLSRYGACYIGQIHPSGEGWKVEKAFYDAWKDRAWFGTLRDFGLWWTARNLVTMDIQREGFRRVVTVNVPKRMEGLAIMLPLRSTPVAVEGGGSYSVDGKLIIFEIAEGPIRITLDN